MENITKIPKSNQYVPNVSSEDINLEKRVNNPFKDTIELMGMNKQPGKFKKYFSLTLAGLGMLFNVGMNEGCVKSDVVNNNKPSYATIKAEDVFTKTGLIGKIVANGIEGQSGDRYRIDSKVITNIEVDVKGYKSTYLFGVKIREGEKIEFARDKNGTFKTLPVNEEITLYLRLIPDSFDTVKFAKSIGNWVIPGDDKLGDGTVIRYDKRNIDVALWELDAPAGGAEKNLKDAIDMININNNIIKLNYKGKVSSYLTDGVTHTIRDRNPVHGEDFNDNIITRSYIETMPTTSFGTILDELLQASSGLRADGGTDHCVYVGINNLVNDAGKAIYLVNFSPPGFQYSNNNPDPATLQNIIVFSTVAKQEYEDAMMKENSYVKPSGVNRMPDDYNGPGRFQHKKHHRK